MTGLLVLLLAAASATLGYGVIKSSPGLVAVSLWITAFAMLSQIIRRGLFMRSFAPNLPIYNETGEHPVVAATPLAPVLATNDNFVGKQWGKLKTSFGLSVTRPATAPSLSPSSLVPSHDDSQVVELAEAEEAKVAVSAGAATSSISSTLSAPLMEMPKPPAPESTATIPFPEYGELSVSSIIKKLSTLSESELGNAREYESAHAARAKIVTRIEQLQRKAALRGE